MPQRNPKEIKSRWHGLRSSLLRSMKKKKEDLDSEIKWTFWKDLEFLRLSLEMDEEIKIMSNDQMKKLVSFYCIPIDISIRFQPNFL